MLYTSFSHPVHLSCFSLAHACDRIISARSSLSVLYVSLQIIQSSSVQVLTQNRKERRNRERGRSSHDCRLERKQMKVRDLGLGYDSDEIVVFKYCVGTCMSARKNYDLALKVLTDNGSVPSRKVSIHPCCRPTRFETVSFMDAQTSWQTIKWLSAANCSCVG
uniref:Artemin a n=1 Tax=Cyprinus carpio TaxID=7962 RepID=A0A8C2IYV1_CYPCA